MTALNWGIVSTGRMSHWFCNDFSRVDRGALRAVCSRDQRNADAFAREYAIEAAYDDYHAMLVDDAVDVIYIGSPHTLHFEHAAAALKAGKAVVCEKPMSVSAVECERLIAIAQESGSYLMEAMWTYFLPSIRKAKSWVDEGRIGKLVQIKTDFGYPVPYKPGLREYDPDLGGGCLLEMGVYPIAIAYLFAQQDPQNICAFASRAPNGVEDDVTAIFSYGDATASLSTSFRARLRNAAYVIGEDGYIVIPDAFRSHEAFLYKLDECIDHFTEPRTTAGYEYQAIAVCDDVAAGRKQSAIMPLSSSLAFQRHIDGVRSAIADQK